MRAVTTPLLNVNRVPLSATVTPVLASGLATTGGASAPRSTGTARAVVRKAEMTKQGAGRSRGALIDGSRCCGSGPGYRGTSVPAAVSPILALNVSNDKGPAGW